MNETMDWEAVIESHADKAYSFALGLCGNPEDAKELVQESFTRAMERIDRHDAAQPFEAWFLTLLKNMYLDSTRRYEKRVTEDLEKVIGPYGMTVADAVVYGRDESLLEGMEREEVAKRVRRALRALNPEARMVLLMVDLDGRKYEEVAQVMDCPLNTVRSRIVRARIALRERLLQLEAMS
jgi:RNA polymerase sigma-70 factor (ECF subfamily)